MSGFALSWGRDRDSDGMVWLLGWMALVVVEEDEDEGIVIVGGSITAGESPKSTIVEDCFLGGALGIVRGHC